MHDTSYIHMKIRNNGTSNTKRNMIIHQNSSSCVMRNASSLDNPKPHRGCGLYYDMESCLALPLKFHRYYVASLVLSLMDRVPPSGIEGVGTKNARMALIRNTILPMRFRIFTMEDKLSWLSPGQLTNLLARTMALSSPYKHAGKTRGTGCQVMSSDLSRFPRAS